MSHYHTGFVPLSAEDEAPPAPKKPTKTSILERKKTIDKTIDDIEKGS
jgi:hypothetical protein